MSAAKSNPDDERTIYQKCDGVAALLRDPAWAGRSSAWIARERDVNPALVERLRVRLGVMPDRRASRAGGSLRKRAGTRPPPVPRRPRPAFITTLEVPTVPPTLLPASLA